jgi:hypothetical protein
MEAGFNILFLARDEREKLESAKRSMISGTEVLTQTIVSQFKSEPSVKIRTATCAPAGTSSAPHTLSSANDLSSPTGDWPPLFPDHTSTFTFTGRPAYHPACACSLIRNILWEEEYILTKSVPEVSFIRNADFCKHPFTASCWALHKAI